VVISLIKSGSLPFAPAKSNALILSLPLKRFALIEILFHLIEYCPRKRYEFGNSLLSINIKGAFLGLSINN